jgi:peroxiredoxin
MKTTRFFPLALLLLSTDSPAQTVSGNLAALAHEEIKLGGFNGLLTYPISTDTLDEKGNFSLPFGKADYGIGYLTCADEKPLFVILNGEHVEIVGSALSQPESMRIAKGKENQYFEQYAKEQPRRDQAMSAWMYLEKIYTQDGLFSVQEKPTQAIQAEKQRIKQEDAAFLSKLPKDSYVSWFLPTRKLVSSVSTIAQYRTEEIPAAIASFRAMDYTDTRLYKSGLFKEAIDNHFWLLENCGKNLDSVFIEMKASIDAMLIPLLRKEKILNEVVGHLFDLLEKHSLFQASEYLALKVLNETSCTIDGNLSKQLESYRAMKKGQTAPDIQLGNQTFLNGIKPSGFANLSSLSTPYTLVVFGASWCQKCAEELPKIIQHYVKWRNLGVEVVYVSLDTEAQAFELAAKSYPFFAYCDYQKWDSPVAQNYYVFGTPTFFLLDSNRKILLRPNSVNQVDAWVDWVLVQGNK